MQLLGAWRCLQYFNNEDNKSKASGGKPKFFDIGAGGGGLMMEMAMHGFESAGIEVDRNAFDSCVGNIERVNNTTGAKLDVEVNLKDLKDLHNCK
eukprot:13657309-Ditylum_brightwellii.AAC.1